MNFHHSSVTGITTGCPFHLIIHVIIEPIIHLPYDLQSVGVFAFGVLFYLLWMATGAGLGCDHYGYWDRVIFQGSSQEFVGDL